MDFDKVAHILDIYSKLLIYAMKHSIYQLALQAK